MATRLTIADLEAARARTAAMRAELAAARERCAALEAERVEVVSAAAATIAGYDASLKSKRAEVRSVERVARRADRALDGGAL